jgi:hypothetical protein
VDRSKFAVFKVDELESVWDAQEFMEVVRDLEVDLDTKSFSYKKFDILDST